MGKLFCMLGWHKTTWGYKPRYEDDKTGPWVAVCGRCGQQTTLDYPFDLK